MSQSESLIAVLTNLRDAGRKVLNGLNARIDAAPSTAKPVFSGIVDLHDELNRADELLARPSTADRGGEVEVKALQWEQPDISPTLESCWLGHGTDWCQYYIGYKDGSWWMPFDSEDAAEFDTVEAAKAAAQADYATRIRSALATTAGEGWQTMDSAPKDGSRLWLANSLMENPVIGQWDDYRTPTGKVIKVWIVTHDPHERFQPLRYGTLISPTRWQPLPAALVTDKG